jgi:hypothetical protein
MKRSFLVISGFVLMISISLAFTETKHDDPIYKNLKILPKNITKEQMDSVMHHFENSLGVGCGYCHVRNDSTRKTDFVSDANPHKNKAREMMKMMDKINDKYFDVTGAKRSITTQLMVTCYTCHHGAAEPPTIPPKRERPQQRPPQDSTKKDTTIKTQ